MADQRTTFSSEEEMKFQSYFDLAEADDADLELEEEFDLYDQYFTTPTETRAYRDWLEVKHPKEPKKAYAAAADTTVEDVKGEPYPLAVYRGQLQHANFTDVDNVAILDTLLNSGFHPHIPVGYSKNNKSFAFRLVPNTRILRPTKEMNWQHNSNKVVLPKMILGINHGVRSEPEEEEDEELEAICRYLKESDSHSSDDDEFAFATDSLENYVRLAEKVATFHGPGKPYGKYGKRGPAVFSDDTPAVLQTMVSPKRRTRTRAQMLSEKSARSGDSTTPNDATGFAFYQLGALHYCNTLADPTTTDTEQIFAHEWYSTDYVLVAKIDGLGGLGDIWILWNFYGDRSDVPPIWVRQGNLPGTKDFVTAAKIADSFADLKADREIRFNTMSGERFEEDFELVGCFRLPYGPIVR